MSFLKRFSRALAAFTSGDDEDPVIEFTPEEEPDPVSAIEFDPDLTLTIFWRLGRSEVERKQEIAADFAIGEEIMAAGMRIVELSRRSGFSEGQTVSLIRSVWASVTDDELRIYGYRGEIN